MRASGRRSIGFVVLVCAVQGWGARPGRAAPAFDIASEPSPKILRARYLSLTRRVADMPGNQRVCERAARHGLDVLNLLWEDTGRFQGSSVGPNISDVTIEVEAKGASGRSRTALMPVLRFPNFSDMTGDVPLDRIWLNVGNHVEGGAVERVTLRDYLAEPARYMSLPSEGTITDGSLLTKRDSHALVSAQATFLPIAQDGQATFWPVIFNYQSVRKHPAVLTLLVTRQGTSMTVIDNARDTVTEESWGQRLFFNHGGQRAPLTAERLSTVQQNGVTANGEAASSLGADANVLMIVQVPLKVGRSHRLAAPAAPMMDMLDGALSAESESRGRRSDMEMAVLGHGPVLGPYTELDGLTIARDPRFPVRVTVQFYQATSTGSPSAADVKALARQIRRVYRDADYVGSLVVPSAADRERPTNWSGVGPAASPPRCRDFPGLVERGVCWP